MDQVGGEPRTELGPVVASLAERLNHLFSTVHPAGRGEYSYREVAAAIEGNGGPTISAAYINYLRLGRRNNPTLQHLEALAGFFGVPVSYFTDADMADRVELELDLLAAIRDGELSAMALRAFGEDFVGEPLDEETLRALLVIRDEIRKRRGAAAVRMEREPDA